MTADRSAAVPPKLTTARSAARRRRLPALLTAATICLVVGMLVCDATLRGSGPHTPPPAGAEPGRWVFLEGAANARDAGGYDPLLVLIAVRIPTVVPDERRSQAAETVVRANYGLLVGCFDLDMRDGTLGFRASLPVVDAVVTQEQFDATWRTALSTTDKYHRAFCRLLYGDDLSPAEVVAEVEMAKQ
jgi:hypothetical protein